MAGNIRRNRNNELLAELEAVQRALASQTTSGLSGPSGPPGPQGDQGLAGEDIFQSGTRQDLTTPGIAAGLVTLLTANSGTDTNASPANVDTYAISGLTVKDTLLIFYSITTTGSQTAAGSIYHVTDATSLIATSTLTVNTGEMATVTIRPAPTNSSIYMAHAEGIGAVAAGSGGATIAGVVSYQLAFATAFTANWTIALRHGGVTGGGTFGWSWTVYKIAGQ